jgi:hypothetical protein
MQNTAMQVMPRITAAITDLFFREIILYAYLGVRERIAKAILVL